MLADVKPDRPDSPPTKTLTVRGRGTFLAVEGLEPQHLECLLREHATHRGGERCLKLKYGTLVTKVPVSVADGLCELVRADDVVVKEVPIPWRRRLGYRLGIVSRFGADFDKVRRLAELGVRSPRILTCSLHPRGDREYEMMEFIGDGGTAQERLWLGDKVLEGAKKVELLYAVGEWMRSLHEYGIWQRDLKPENIYILGEGNCVDDLHLLDTAAVRFFDGPIDLRRRVRNLAQVLDLPPGLDAEAPEPLFAGYRSGRGAPFDHLERRVELAVAGQRERREANTGFRYVDEEYYGTREQ